MKGESSSWGSKLTSALVLLLEIHVRENSGESCVLRRGVCLRNSTTMGSIPAWSQDVAAIIIRLDEWKGSVLPKAFDRPPGALARR
jgi:hypothetical protein